MLSGSNQCLSGGISTQIQWKVRSDRPTVHFHGENLQTDVILPIVVICLHQLLDGGSRGVGIAE